MNSKNLLAYIGIGLASVGGYMWMINYISIALILWGITFIIIFRINRLKKMELNRLNKPRNNKHKSLDNKSNDSRES